MDIKVKFDTNKMCATLDNIGEDILQMSPSVGMDIATRIMEQSANEVPVDTATLKNSQYIIQNGDEIEFGYGGPNDKTRIYNDIDGNVITEKASEYAEIVHEDLQQHHNVGKAKYLEDPINDNAQYAKEAMAYYLSSAIQQSVKTTWKWHGRGKRRFGFK